MKKTVYDMRIVIKPVREMFEHPTKPKSGGGFLGRGEIFGDKRKIKAWKNKKETKIERK